MKVQDLGKEYVEMIAIISRFGELKGEILRICNSKLTKSEKKSRINDIQKEIRYLRKLVITHPERKKK